jgi:hypothetical protein
VSLEGVDPVAGNDFILKSWASHRPDINAENAPQSDDRGPATLFVHVVGTLNKTDHTRVHFVENCGPLPFPSLCNTNSRESQWVAEKPLSESFSSGVRIAEIRVFKGPTNEPGGDTEEAFCSVFLEGHRSDLPSNCNVGAGNQQIGDCKVAFPSDPPMSPAAVAFDGPAWKVTFDDAMARCPNNPDRKDIFVEFTLGQ